MAEEVKGKNWVISQVSEVFFPFCTWKQCGAILGEAALPSPNAQ